MESNKDKIINLFGGQQPSEAERKFLDELEEIGPDDLDDFYGTDLDEERWSVYQKIANRFLSLVGKDESIVKVAYDKEPVHTKEIAIVGVTFPIISSPGAELKKAISDALCMCSTFCVSAAEEKVWMGFSVGDIWKTNQGGLE